MVGWKLVRAIHVKAGRNTGGFIVRAVKMQLQFNKPQLPYQRFLVRALQLYTLAAPDSYEWLPTVWKQAMDLCCKSPLSMSCGYTSAPEPRRTRLFSAGSIRPSSKTTWSNNSDSYAQSLASMWLLRHAFVVFFNWHWDIDGSFLLVDDVFSFSCHSL